MVCQPLRLALLIGAITAVAVSPARANHPAPACGNPCGSSVTTAPCYRTITCTEWVRETYQVKRTAYRVECRTEVCDSFRCECVPECRERVVCCVKKIPVVREECRKVCHHVTCYEERMVNKTCYKYVQETCCKKKLVRLGHWECREVQPLFSGFGHGNCCDSCCNDCCKTRTRKVWVHCPEYCDCPYTVCKKVCYTVCVPCKVPVCRTEWREEKVKVCTYQCVTENRVEKCTVYVTRKVPCKVTRTVRVCVPYEECVTCCKMVPRCVTRQVCDTCCNTCNTCCDTCCTSHGNFFSRFGGWRRNNCCDTCCDRGCCH